MSKPLYLNGGRGRGRGQNRAPASGLDPSRPGASRGPPPGLAQPVRPGHNAPGNGTANPRTAAVAEVAGRADPSRQEQAKAMQERTQALVTQMRDDGALSSSSDEDDEEYDDSSTASPSDSRAGSGGGGSTAQEAIFASTLKMYQEARQVDSHLGEDGLKVDSTRHILNEACSKRGNVCLVCIETIKRTDAVWNCCNCYGMLHLQCAQQWAREGVFVSGNAAADSGADGTPAPPTFWACPKCRHEYPRTKMPSVYLCYCGEQQDPTFDRWLTPHSCGETCGRPLKPNCGHTCMLLCHPGPCPPCPRTVQSGCFCGQSTATTRRCVARGWSCGKPCSRALSCGQHRCARPCHGGDECEPCARQSNQPCRCGRKSALRPCAESVWSCEKVCGRELPCRNHVCEEACHSGGCGDCPRAGQRSCPCGKSSSSLPCSEDIPTCGDTCGKVLPCGIHRCTRRCHRGDCDQCRQMVTKSCRCGRQKKSVPCCQELLCESKCTGMRQCSRHPCKRKCCDGDCPPCDKLCGKQLQCRNHKCSSPCHSGPCYPCIQTEPVGCRCGGTVVRVPCGRKRVTRPPRCALPCKIAPDCHHSSREPHRCHTKECPRCRQTCSRPLTGCRHPCPLPCHDHVRAKEDTTVSLAPWEQAARSQQAVASRVAPCPKCKVPVIRSCVGSHETSSQACSEQRDYSCGRQCGRALSCGNHACRRQCHGNAGDVAANKAGPGCQKCEEVCGKPRPSGCEHECARRCHPGACPPCKELVRLRCHCGSLPLVIKCPDYAACSSNEARDALRCCRDQCPKLLPCGHRCHFTCHAGDCSSAAKCSSRITRRCPCKRLSVKFKCSEVVPATLECDSECEQHKLQRQKSEDAEKRKRDAEDEERSKAEIAQFERQQQGRQRKRKAKVQEEAPPSWWQRNRYVVLVTILIIVGLAALLYIMKRGAAAAVVEAVAPTIKRKIRRK